MKNSTINRRQALKQVVSAMAGSSVLSYANGSQAEPVQKPNIVFIIADDMGWSDIGYNNPEIKTPHVDALAAGGVTLTHHYAMPTCTPTRMGIMTGHFPSRYGVYGPDYGKLMNDDTETLAHTLQKSGYRTVLSGKWHLGSPPEYTPLKYGFDSSYGYFAGQIDPYTHLYKTGIQSWHRNDEYVKEEGHATDLITNDAVRVINESNEKPFFLYLSYSVPHFPLDEPDEWTSMYSHIEEPSRRWFNASVTHMDHGIGRVVKALDQKGIRENTLIVFVSDNGGQESWRSNTQYKGRYADKPHTVLGNNTPLRGWKGDVYEGGIRVPAFVNWKGRVKPGECNTPIHIVDWMPTLCGVGQSMPARDLHWDGANVWEQIVTKNHHSMERPLYWHTRNMTAVQHNGWKLITRKSDGKSELYHVMDDPLEKNNLISQQQTQFQSLQKIMQNLQKRDNTHSIK